MQHHSAYDHSEFSANIFEIWKGPFDCQRVRLGLVILANELRAPRRFSKLL